MVEQLTLNQRVVGSSPSQSTMIDNHVVPYQAMLFSYKKSYKIKSAKNFIRYGDDNMLSELMIRQAQPRNKPYSLSDKRGLLLTVHPNGHKYWILRMYINGKERRRSVGTWPDLSLKDARQKVHEIIKQSVNHDDNTDGAVFKDLAAEWLKVRMADKKQSYIRTIKLRLNKFILPQTAI